MFRYLASSLPLSAGYTVILVSIALLESLAHGAQIRFNSFVWAVLLIFALSSLAVLLLRSLVTVHLRLAHQGWKRLLFAAAGLVAPVFIYTAYQIERITNIPEHILVVTGGAALAYVTVMSLFLGVRWIADGFNQPT